MALPEIIKDIESRVKDTGDIMTGKLTILTNNKTVAFGCDNTQWAHYYTDATNGHWFNTNLYVKGNIYAGTNYSDLVLTAENFNNYTPTLTGTGASGTWNINITGKSDYADYIIRQDTRNINQTPLEMLNGLSVHLKSKGADGLEDGDGYHPSIHVKSWQDYSGGPWGQIAMTLNQNLWFRVSTSGTAWGSWKKVLDSSNYSQYALPLTGGTITGSLSFGTTSTTNGPQIRFFSNKRSYIWMGYANDNGSWYLWDSHNNKGIITSNIGGVNSFHGNADTATSANSLDNKFYAGRNTPPNTTGVRVGMPPYVALALKNCGYGIHNDAEFASGNNSVNVYNNSGNGTVTVTRIADSTAANTSGYVIQIKHTGTASPGFGGFYQSIMSRANAVFFQLFRAKIPVGYYVTNASNAMGTGYSDFWVTDRQGTGKWEWYGRIVMCGETGSFSSGGHVYLSANSGYASPTTSAPITWYLSYCNCFDLTKGAYLNATSVYGAVWNDYAEYRQTVKNIKPGMVVIEQGDGSMEPSTNRLQPGGSIVSDTFGFAIGETDNCKTPLAVSGRALAYPAEDRYSYEPGDAVGTGPNGTVSKMTREEIMMYPERIIGTVSEIPEYERWGTGNVLIDGRIWIKVK